jgi:hypothetical protein
VLAGIFFGICSIIFIEVLKSGRKVAEMSSKSYTSGKAGGLNL